MAEYVLAVGRIIHINGMDAKCIPAIVTALPTTNSLISVTVFYNAGPSFEAARRTYVDAGALGKSWHDPRECHDTNTSMLITYDA